MPNRRYPTLSLGLGTPAQYVLLARADHPVLRVDAYRCSDECFAFNDAIVCKNHLVIGWGEHVYLIHLDSQTVVKRELSSYFGHLYAYNDCLLVASADQLLRIAADTSIVWRSDVLALDGVIINNVDAGVIHGSGEWNPPGGWRPFQIRLDSGKSPRAT